MGIFRDVAGAVIGGPAGAAIQASGNKKKRSSFDPSRDDEGGGDNSSSSSSDAGSDGGFGNYMKGAGRQMLRNFASDRKRQ